MRIRKNNNCKIVFQVRYGYFEYQVIFFGLSNTFASFQEYVNKILAKKLDVFVIVYLYYILIYIVDAGKSHVEVVWLVFGEL